MTTQTKIQNPFLIHHKKPGLFNRFLVNSLKEKILLNDKHHKIRVSGLTNEIQTFRNETYAQKAPYLLSSTHHKIVKEAELDQRSFHFTGTFNHKLCSSLRLTTFPFESVALFPHLKDDIEKRFSHYIELNRLISKNQNQTIFLFMQAAIYAQELGYEGFISICTKSNFNKFKKFGVLAQSDLVKIEYRNNQEYYIISSNFTKLNILGLITYFIMRHFGKVR